MRRGLRVLIAGSILFVLFSFPAAAAAAQPADSAQPSDVKVADLFSWFKAGDRDWGAAGSYAVLGLVGAMVIAFGLIGGVVPGTAGRAKIDTDEARLLRLSVRLEELAKASPIDAPALTAVNSAVDELRDDTRSERWRQYTVAMVMYAFLGAFFAAMLAKDLLQALAIGAGWTGVIGSLGLKSDFSARKAAKDDALTEVSSHLEEQTKKAAVPDTPPEVKKVVQKALAARAL
jgi:hypothetical protein